MIFIYEHKIIICMIFLLILFFSFNHWKSGNYLGFKKSCNSNNQLKANNFCEK